MSIQNDWNDFKEPMKQVGHNFKENLQEYTEESRRKYAEENKQNSCEDFYGPDNMAGDKLRGITESAPQLTVKSKKGARKIAFGVEAFKINEGNPYEALYIDYTALRTCPAVEVLNKRPQRTSGMVWIILFGLLGIIFTEWLFIGCLIGVYKYLTAPAVATLKFFLQEDETECTYVMEEVTLRDCYAVLNNINNGLAANIRYYNTLFEKSNRRDEDLADYIKHLESLKEELLATYSDERKA